MNFRSSSAVSEAREKASSLDKGKSKMIDAIPVTRIYTLVEELRLPRVDFIKADIKGATEWDLKGATAVTSRFSPCLAVSTEEPPEDRESVARLMERISPGDASECGPCLVANGEISTDVIFLGRGPAP